MKFQIQLSGQWKDYSSEENAILCRAFMSGSKQAKYQHRGQNYQYDFSDMQQINLASGKRRKIRAPPNLKPPSAPLVPPGPTMMVTVPPGATAGAMLEVPHPMNKTVRLQVAVPAGAQAGSTLLVPVPNLPPGATTPAPGAAPPADTPSAPPADQQQDQTGDNNPYKAAPVSTAAGVGAGVAGLGLAAGAGAIGYAAATGGLDGAGDAIVGAAGDIGSAVGNVDLGTIGGVAMDGVDSIGDALGDFAGDAGDFVMNLF